MAVKRYAFTLTGISPLLMSWDNIEHSDLVKAWQMHPDNSKLPNQERGSDRFPAFTWIGRLYNDGVKVALPTPNLQTCLRDAGQTIQVSGGRGKSYKEASQTAILFEAEYLEFKGGTTELKEIPIEPILKLNDVANSMPQHCKVAEKLGFKIDIRRASPKPGTKHIRCRPRFDRWQASGVFIHADPDAMSMDVVKQVFEIAGSRKGLCDWRPGGKKPGPMGRFTVQIKPA